MKTNPQCNVSNQALLLSQTVYAMTKNGFRLKTNADGSMRFDRPNSEAALKLTTEPNRVVIRKDFNGPLMLGEPFIRELIGSGLYTFYEVDGECVMVSTSAS